MCCSVRKNDDKENVYTSVFVAFKMILGDEWNDEMKTDYFVFVRNLLWGVACSVEC